MGVFVFNKLILLITIFIFIKPPQVQLPPNAMHLYMAIHERVEEFIAQYGERRERQWQEVRHNIYHQE